MKLTIAAALCALALTAWSSAGSPTGRQGESQVGAQAKGAPRWGTEQEAERIRTGLRGAWRLTRVKQGAETFEGVVCEGYMLVTEEHLSMQARLEAPSGALPGHFIEGFSAGTYRWMFDLGRQKLVIHTAMAVSDFGPDLEWEPIGSQREYDVILTEDELTLERAGEAEFRYQRVRPTPPNAPRKSR